MKYLSVAQVLRIHHYQVKRFGGMPGVNFRDMLESAVAQPGMTFAGTDLFPTLTEKAGALAYSLAKNRPFHDGNKRTSHAAMAMFLSRNGAAIKASLKEQETIFLRLAGAHPRLSRDGLVAWVRVWIARK